MKFSKTLKTKSVVITFVQMNALIDKLTELTQHDLQDAKRRRLKLELGNFAGETFSFDNKDEFLDCVKTNIRNLKELRLSYSIEDVSVKFYFYTGFSTSFNASVEAEDKSKILLIQDEIEKYMSAKSWNFLADKIIPLILPTLFFIAIFVVATMFREILKPIIKDTLSLIVYSFLIVVIWFGANLWLGFKLPRYYPALVIEDNNYKSGRVFRKDLKLLIGFVILYITLPFIINIVSK